VDTRFIKARVIHLRLRFSRLTPTYGIPAPSRVRPLESTLLPRLRCQARVVLPVRGKVLEIVHLVVHPNAAVGVDGADLLRIVVVLAEPAV